jgi:hypothetical protein
MEKMGRQRLVDKVIVPQEAGVMPQQLGNLTVAQALQNRLGVYLLGGYKGQTVFIDLDKLVNQPLILAEKAYALDRIDSRNGVQVTVPDGSEIGTVVTGEIGVPAGEVWYLNRLSVVCPAADATGTASFNILVSSWPLTEAGTPKGYFATNQVAMGATTDIDLPAQGELGEELRLVGGNKLILQLTVTVAFTEDKVFRLNPFGRKGKALVA